MLSIRLISRTISFMRLRECKEKEITTRQEGDLLREDLPRLHNVSEQELPHGRSRTPGFNCTHRHSSLYKLIDLLPHFLINPNLTARRTHFGRHVLEQVNLAVSLLLMGDGGGLQLATTDSTAWIVCFGCHDLLLRLCYGSSHLRGSSQWTVMT